MLKKQILNKSAFGIYNKIEFLKLTFSIFKSVIVKLPKNKFFDPDDSDDAKKIELSNSVSVISKLLM